MSIKLLPKSEIDRKKAVEQKVAIDEGAKLAKRVDRLRELSVDTEAEFTKWRNEAIAKINDEIAQKSQEKAKIVAEVNEATTLLARLQKPLDEEWARVREASGELNRRTEEANVVEHRLDDREGEVALKEKKVASALLKATTKDDLATSNLRDAASSNNAAQLARESAQRLKEETIKSSDTLKKELTHREELVTTREESATIKETDLALRETALADGWKLLKDRQATLARSINSVKKSSNGN